MGTGCEVKAWLCVTLIPMGQNGRIPAMSVIQCIVWRIEFNGQVFGHFGRDSPLSSERFSGHGGSPDPDTPIHGLVRC